MKESNEKLNQKFGNFCGIHLANVPDISRKTYEWNDIEKTVDRHEILWLNEKHYKEGLDQKNLQEITKKYNSNHKNIDMN